MYTFDLLTGKQIFLDKKEIELALSSTYANTALSNLASVAINTSLISDTDSTDDLGSSAKYWANSYTDKLYLNATATLDGSSAGNITVVGNLIPNSTVNLGSASKYWGMVYFTQLNLSGGLNYTAVSPSGIFINTSATQYTSTGFFLYSDTASLTTYAGVHMASNIQDVATTNADFAIDQVDYQGNYVAHLMKMTLLYNETDFYTFLRIANSGGIEMGHYYGDSYPIIFGAGNDASIYYDGTNLVVNPKVVGAGFVNVLGDIAVSGVKVIGARVIDARCDDAINSGDATTDGVIDSLRDALIAHGLIAAA